MDKKGKWMYSGNFRRCSEELKTFVSKLIIVNKILVVKTSSILWEDSDSLFDKTFSFLFLPSSP